MRSAEFCDLCIKLHSKIMTPESEKEHTANESKSRVAKLEMPCKNHCKEALRYLCITCEEPICSECLIMKHRRHQLSKMEEHGDVYRAQVFLFTLFERNRPLIYFICGLDGDINQVLFASILLVKALS